MCSRRNCLLRVRFSIRELKVSNLPISILFLFRISTFSSLFNNEFALSFNILLSVYSTRKFTFRKKFRKNLAGHVKVKHQSQALGGASALQSVSSAEFTGTKLESETDILRTVSWNWSKSGATNNSRESYVSGTRVASSRVVIAGSVRLGRQAFAPH